MKSKKDFEIEIMRHNVTPAQFLSYVRGRVDEKGGKWFRGDLDNNWFKNGDTHFAGSGYDFGTPETRPCAAERIIDKPYEKQTYIRNFDGSVYNEICEFQFDDDKRGTGYYYLVNTSVDAEDAESNKREYLEYVARHHESKIAWNEKKVKLLRAELDLDREHLAGWAIRNKERDIEDLERESEELREAMEECKKYTSAKNVKAEGKTEGKKEMKKESKQEIYARYGIEYRASDGKILSPIGWINPLLVNGNEKIGKGAYHFSTLPTNKEYTVCIDEETEITVRGTCPCFCKGCYATKGNYRFNSVVKALAIRTIIAREYLDFMKRAIMAQIEAEKVHLCRIHAAGDFFSMEYANAWREIAEKMQNVVFWTYTKNRACESLFDGLQNANIVKSIINIDGFHGFNFGHCDYIMNAYRILSNAGYKVHVCFCGIEKAAKIETKHCTGCKCCSECEYVLFLEHSTEYKAEEDALFPELVKMVMSQKIQ